MQGIENHYAEDSCLKNPTDVTARSAHVGTNTNDNARDSGIFKETAAENPVNATAVNDENLEKGIAPQDGPGSSSDDASISDQEKKDDFPEGGLKAWSVVVGSFCGSFSVFGIINSTAVLLEYLSTHQLKDYSPSQIGWIFGLSLFLTFFCGAPIGPIFDAYGPRVLIFSGSILLILSMMLLGLCTGELTFPHHALSTYADFCRILALLYGI
jgi:hypothetical protein